MSLPLFQLTGPSGWKNLFSQDCTLCGSRSSASVCASCVNALPYVRATGCPHCAIEGPAGLICGACLAAPLAFDRTVAAFRYTYPLDRLVQAFKFNENLALVNLFADSLFNAVQTRQSVPDLIVPLPLARKRLADRGFNQSALLAERVARRIGVPYIAQGLLKIRDTPPQAGLDRAARLKNVRGAFACERSLDGKHVAVVDDVMTTGATLSEAARSLKKSGAATVSAWVVARAGREWSNLASHDGIDAAIPFSPS